MYRNYAKSLYTYDIGSFNGGAPRLWKTPSTNTPFFPLHLRKKLGDSNLSSRCFLEMKLECPMFTSTLPSELFLPIIIRLCRTRYSNSRPSSFAIGATALTVDHTSRSGRELLDLRAKRAKASLSLSR